MGQLYDIFFFIHYHSPKQLCSNDEIVILCQVEVSAVMPAVRGQNQLPGAAECC